LKRPVLARIEQTDLSPSYYPANRIGKLTYLTKGREQENHCSLPLLLFALEVVGGGFFMLVSAGQAKEFLQIVNPATIGLLGTSVGFHFGAHASSGG
jgi:hypothetical protein